VDDWDEADELMQRSVFFSTHLDFGEALPPLPFRLLSSPFRPPLEVRPHCSLGVWGSAPQRVQAESGRQTYFGAF